MAKPKVFISSTFVDLQEIRDNLGNFFNDVGFETKLFEKGGVFYDPNKPLDESCYKEVSNSDLFILVIGGRYGNPASSENKTKINHDYNSITKNEYSTARELGIPTYVFVKTQVHAELATYRNQDKNIRDKVKYTHVDNIAIFKLIEDVYTLKKGNPLFNYETSSNIIEQLKSQLAGMWSEYLISKKTSQNKKSRTRLNSYKMFFMRDQENLSFGQLAKKIEVEPYYLLKLERISTKYDEIEPNIFPYCDNDVIDKLEKYFNCRNYLRVGRDDDFLSLYIQYYAAYKGKKKSVSSQDNMELKLFPTKAVVFDFDGTLTSRNRSDDLTTWEKIWVSLGYDVNDCSKYHKQFSDKKITHAQWCNITCNKFSSKSLRESHLNEIAKNIELIAGAKEVLEDLHTRNIKTFILSGSIRQIIKPLLGNLYDYFDDIKANDLIFDTSGNLIKIKGTKYDFEGKAQYIKGIISENGFSPLEVLFVGNSCNDVFASQSGARTLCINPHFTDPNKIEHWSYCLRKVHDLREILDYVY